MKCTRRHFTTGLLATGVSTCLGGCSTNQATGRSSFTGFYSLEDDIKLGRSEAPKLTQQFGGAYTDARLNQYVTDVGSRLSKTSEMKDLDFTFTIVNSPVVNAFALPGGFVFVSRGLLALAENEAEMAGVLAHEIGHVTARHTAERMSQGMLAQIGAAVLGIATGSQALSNLASYGAKAYIQGFSRSQEMEADTLGVRYMSRAGYDPDAMVSFLSSLREQSMLDAKMKGLPAGSVDEFNAMATHPRTVERVREAMKNAATAHVDNPRIAREVYLDLVNGLLYGDDPAQGVIQGQTFIHPGLRFEFTVPEGFRLFNSPSQVVAQHADGAAIVFDMGQNKSSKTMTAYLDGEWTGGKRVAGLQALSVNGVEAATATVNGAVGGQAAVVRLLALRGDDDKVFRFLFAAPKAKVDSFNLGFRRSTYSFRRLSQQEADAVHALRLLVVKAQADDTVTKLSKTLPFGEFNEETFRVLNGLKSGEEVQAGRLIKVIAG